MKVLKTAVTYLFIYVFTYSLAYLTTLSVTQII
jgi:hypothetical protein